MKLSPKVISFLVVLCLAGCSAQNVEAPHKESTSSSIITTATQPDWTRYPGALVGTSMHGVVGVLLDEIPESQRNALVQTLGEKPAEFWIDRAKRQIRLTSLRLNFRNGGGKFQLPLPAEDLWTITLAAAPRRATIDGHDLLVMDYDYSGILLTSEGSPGASEPVLGTVGGKWSEEFVFPVDPEFIFQRTGFACYNESQFPANSADAEEADLFYDHRCGVESRLTNTGCHQTELPKLSCITALKDAMGQFKTSVVFERLPWNPNTASEVRTGSVTNTNGPDLQPYQAGFKQHRFTYRYIPDNSCTLVEKCVGGPGWRQVLMFPTGDINAGVKALEIGKVDYFHEENGSVLSQHGVFEFSACHGHYHFAHYGSFTLGEGSEAITNKNGFCLQPSSRIFNNELSPLHHPYVNCIHQGVSVGWIDEYRMGLECQWVDVTDVPAGRDLPLSFTSNPDGLLCEGNLRTDAQGNTLFEPSEFRTASGEPVEKPQCDVYSEWFANNRESYDVRLPGAGESYVTGACREGLFGEMRNCGLRNTKKLSTCLPGKTVTISCSVPAGSDAQIIRVCEGSKALNTGIPCTYNDALASTIIETRKEITFTCPAARDGVETGGVYSFLEGSLLGGEQTDVTCVPKE